MRLATALGSVMAGISAEHVRVEVDVSNGLPAMNIVGMAGTSVSESRWRVRSAMEQASWEWPKNRITVSLSPAEMPKGGTSLDLAIAVATHAAHGKLPREHLQRSVLIGELGLDASVRPVRGALAMTLAAARAGLERILVPDSQWKQCARVPGINVVGVANLSEVPLALVAPHTPRTRDDDAFPPASEVETTGEGDWSDIEGQESAKYGAMVAAVGGHHIALFGSPGLGKSMIAQRFVSILPDLSPELALEVQALHALDSAPQPSRRPPVQMPHHSASPAAILGTAHRQQVVPGALTMAHGGVLILDEVPEFARSTLEGLRQPWEAGFITVHRAGWAGVLPARVQVVMTANPCPCGWHGVASGAQACTCAPHKVRSYQARLSGPLMDRIDVRMQLVPEETHSILARASSTDVRDLVTQARARARDRWGEESLNAWVCAAKLREKTALSSDMERHLDRLSRRGRRGVDRVLRVAWSVADLRGEASLDLDHLATAISLWGDRDDVA